MNWCRTSLLGLFAMAVVLVGCTGSREPDARPDVAALRARLGSADTIVANLAVQITPAQGDGQLFTLRLWCVADGAVRLTAKYQDVAFLDALVRANGGYEAVLVREKVATAGTLGSPEDPPLLRDLQLLLGDLRDGPLPRTATPVADIGRVAWSEGGWAAEMDIGSDDVPSVKRLSVDGVLQRELTYTRWQTYDGLTRPSQVRLRIAGDAGMTAIRVKSLETPPVISPERMALRIPDDVERVDPAEFTQRMPQ